MDKQALWAHYQAEHGDTAAARRAFAYAMFTAGEFANAVPALLQLVQGEYSAQATDHDYSRLIASLYEVGDYVSARHFGEQALAQYPEHEGLLTNHGMILYLLDEFDKSRELLECAYAMNDNNLTVIDGLCVVYNALARPHDCRRFAERGLQYRDAEAFSHKNVKRLQQWIGATVGIPKTPPPFDPSINSRNIVAFSLWGDRARYLEPAVLNAQAMPHVYPGWQARFYCDNTVPAHIIDQLLTHCAQVVMMPPSKRPYEGLLWRFLVANDANVQRFLVRDCDSVINCQERLAVDEWLASDKCFHVLRDWPCHSELILAGLWGGVANVLPDMRDLIDKFYASEAIERTLDQRFLRLCIWPLIKPSVLCHDDFNTLGEEQRFATIGAYPKQSKSHVGENFSASQVKSIPKRYKTSYQRKPTVKQCVYTLSTGRSGTAYLAALCQANITEAEVWHEKSSVITLGKQAPSAACVSEFNQQGNTPALQKFWRQKLLQDSRASKSCYIETSHFLAKAGLLHNLSILQALDIKVCLIDLRRDEVQTAWSLLNRFDFHHIGLQWPFYLSSSFKRCIVDAKPYRDYAVLGEILWYIHEMATRAEYYKLVLAKEPYISIQTVDLSVITQTSGAQSLLAFLGYRIEQVQLPAKTNAQTEMYFPQSALHQLEQLQAQLGFDYQQRAAAFLREGKSL